MVEIKKILPFVKPYWKTAALSLVTLIIMVLAELSIPRLIERIIDQGIQQDNLSVVISTSIIMVGISLINALAAILNNIFSIRTGESVARDVRKAIFQKVQQFSYGDLDRYNTGTLMVRLTSDAGAVQRLVQITLRIGTRAPLMMIGSIILMFLTSARLAFTILPVLLVSGMVVALFSLRMEPLFRVVQQKLDRLNTVLQENLAGARVVKAFVRGEFESQRFEKANQDYAGHTVSVMRTMAAMSPTLTVFINIGIVLVIWYGGLQVMSGGLQLGQIVAFTNYLLSTMTPLVMMGGLANTWANGMASAKRINEILDTIPEVNHVQDAAALPAGMESKVAFQEVDFHYRGNSSQNVLENITLSAGAGQMVAVLGATGAGKSSLVNLIPRFYDVTGGSVKVNGLDVRTLQEDYLLGEVGIVPQETILFSGTIRENICYGKPDASDEEVFTAARAAQAHDFIMSFPRGYDTHIEERGVNLSGGQKQRIAIARAIITNPRILILDDATSSVDVVTETRIQDALKGIMQERISFVVAQRISTVLNADKIIVLDEGRIAAEGNHAELIKTSRIYQEIYDSQLGNGFEISIGGKTE